MHEVEYIGRGPRREVTTGSSTVWVCFGVLAVAMVMFMQWFRGDLFSTTMKAAPASIAASEAVEGGQHSEFAMNAKVAVKMRRAGMDEEAKLESAASFKEVIVPLAVTRTERLRLAIVAAELVDKDDAIARITALQKDMEAGTPLAMDAAWVKILYEKGQVALSEEVQTSLLDRHGWFGELALAFGRPVNDSFRRSAVGGREKITGTFKLLGRLQLVLFLVGIGALALMATRMAAAPLEGPGMEGVPQENLQGFVLFCAGFVVVLGISMLPFGFGAEGSVGATVASELSMWVLLLIPTWPLVRRVPWSEFRQSVGLTLGRGVAVEVAIGLLAFLAWMPITIGVSQAIEALTRFFGSASVEGSPGGYPMFEAPPSDSALLVFLSFVGSVVWAPLVEETIFRGFLYGWLRERLGFVLTVIATSIVFGIVHPYSPLGMIQVAGAGVMFAILREWRGSLIAPMVAHALHNGQIAAASMAIANAIGG